MIQEKFLKIFLIIEIVKNLGFYSKIKMQNFHLFKMKLIFFSPSSFSYLNLVQLFEIFPTIPKWLIFEKYLKSYSSLKKVCNDTKFIPLIILLDRWKWGLLLTFCYKLLVKDNTKWPVLITNSIHIRKDCDNCD